MVNQSRESGPKQNWIYVSSWTVPIHFHIIRSPECFWDISGNCGRYPGNRKMAVCIGVSRRHSYILRNTGGAHSPNQENPHNPKQLWRYPSTQEMSIPHRNLLLNRTSYTSKTSWNRRSVLGLCNVLWRFVLNFARLVAALSKNLRKNQRKKFGLFHGKK